MSRPARWRQSARGLPHHWAGAYTCWGRENREAALRFVRGTVERAANLELKVIDSANRYLAAACLIGAGLAGLDDGLELPPPLVRDPADISVEERETLGVRRLSADLGEAIEAFNRSSVAPKVLGRDAVPGVRCRSPLRVEPLPRAEPEEVADQLRWRYG